MVAVLETMINEVFFLLSCFGLRTEEEIMSDFEMRITLGSG